MRTCTRALVTLPVLMCLVTSTGATPFVKEYCTPRNVRAIALHGGTAWLATSGGIASYNTNRRTAKLYTDLSQFPDLEMTDAVKDSDGKIWFGTHDGYLIRLDPARLHFATFDALASSGWRIQTMHFFKDHILIGTPQGLSVFSVARSDVISNVKQFGTFSSPDVIRIRSWGDRVVVLTASGIAEATVAGVASANFADPNLWQLTDTTGVIDVALAGDGSTVGVGYLGENIDGRLYVFGTDDNILREDWTDVYQFSTVHRGAVVNCITKVSTDRYLVGTEGEHFWDWNRTAPPPVRREIQGPVVSNVGSMARNRSGALWYIGRDGSSGVGRFDMKTWSVYTSENSPGIGPFAYSHPDGNTHVLVASDGDVIVSTFAYGIKRLDASTGQWSFYQDPLPTIPLPSPPNPLKSYDGSDTLKYWWTFVSSACEDSSGYIWAANHRARNGNVLHVWQRSGNQWRSFNTQTYGLVTSSDFTSATAAAQRGDTSFIYLGFHETEAIKGGGLSIVKYSGDPLRDSVSVQTSAREISVRDVFIEDENDAWVAADDAIYRVRDNRISTLQRIDTLPADKKYRAVFVLSEPQRLSGIAANGDQVCGLATELKTYSTRSLGISRLQGIVYDREVLFARDGDLYAYRPVNDSIFTLMESLCGFSDYYLTAALKDSLPERVTNITKSGILGPRVYDILVEPDRRTVWVASSNGIYRIDRGSAATAAGRDNEDNGDLQVFPNPVSRSALAASTGYRVRFTNAHRDSRVILYTVDGQRVRELSIKQMPDTYNYYFEWDGKSDVGARVQPGTYLYYAFLQDKKGNVGKILLRP